MPYRAGFAPAGALAEKRRNAFTRFEELGFPTRRDEAWRFTNLRPLQETAFAPGTGEGGFGGAAGIEPYLFPGETLRIVLVNGRFAPTLSKVGGLPKGVTLGSAAEIAESQMALGERLLDRTDVSGGQAFASLNAALFADGFVFALEAGIALEKPVEIIHWGDAAESSSHLRNLIQLGAGSRATIIETYAGRGRYWTNAVALIDLAPSAALRHAKLQDEAREAIHFGQVRANIAADARYESFVLTVGGRLSRHDSFATFAGEGAACGLFGAYLLRGGQEATNATFVDHAVPKCATSEVFKGVVDERAHGVFLGKITVRPQAQKTDAHQLNKNLLLSARANVDTKPELEILADDVKCSHGATVGDLDENAMFYLAARGIPADEARRILIEAFVADAIDRIEDDTVLRAHLLAHVQRWLGRKD